MIVTTSAIVLASRKYGDSSKIVSIYTEDFGKVSIIAKGSRSQKNKFGSSLDPLSCSRITLYKSPHKDLHLASAAETHINLRNLKTDLGKMKPAFMIAESVSRTQSEGDANPELFALIAESFRSIDAAPRNPFAGFVHFELCLLDMMGFAPDLTEQHSGSHDVVFNIVEGRSGRLAAASFNNCIRLRKPVWEVLSSISSCGAEEPFAVDITEQDEIELQDFFARYLSYHTDQKFSFRSFGLL